MKPRDKPSVLARVVAISGLMTSSCIDVGRHSKPEIGCLVDPSEPACLDVDASDDAAASSGTTKPGGATKEGGTGGAGGH